MKALLDTNIVIHREAPKGINQDIGMLFKWLDKAGFAKCIHPITVEEIGSHRDPATVGAFHIKLESYELLQTVAPIAPAVEAVSKAFDTTENDKKDTRLLNELYCGRVDILVSEDKGIHRKAAELNIAQMVYTIESFLEKVSAEFPALVDYKVLSVRQGILRKY